MAGRGPNRKRNCGPRATTKFKHLRRRHSRSRTPRRRRPTPGPRGRPVRRGLPPSPENSSPFRHRTPGEQSPRTPAPFQNREGMSREHLDQSELSKKRPERARSRYMQTFARTGVLRIGKSLIFRGSYIPIPPFWHMWRDQRCICVIGNDGFLDSWHEWITLHGARWLDGSWTECDTPGDGMRAGAVRSDERPHEF